MVDGTKMVVGIFTAVGVLAITALVLYLIAKALKKYKPSKKADFPTAEYMNRVGLRCPSGWVYRGTMTSDSGETFDVCHNSNNIPVCRDWAGKKDVGSGPNKKKIPGCYSIKGQPIALFPTIDNWDDYIKGDVTDDYRCNWINRCGPPSEVYDKNDPNISPDARCANTPPASWVGISDKC